MPQMPRVLQVPAQAVRYKGDQMKLSELIKQLQAIQDAQNGKDPYVEDADGQLVSDPFYDSENKVVVIPML